MNTTASSHPQFSDPDWQILGELELPVGVSTNDAIHTWLMEILASLNLHADFLNKILKSAQDAATRILQAEVGIKFRHIHLIVFVPPNHTSKEQTWGFFRVEKIENTADDKVALDHSIGFYLYVEGQ